MKGLKVEENIGNGSKTIQIGRKNTTCLAIQTHHMTNGKTLTHFSVEMKEVGKLPPNWTYDRNRSQRYQSPDGKLGFSSLNEVQHYIISTLHIF